jgi:hypothetical protein
MVSFSSLFVICTNSLELRIDICGDSFAREEWVPYKFSNDSLEIRIWYWSCPSGSQWSDPFRVNRIDFPVFGIKRVFHTTNMDMFFKSLKGEKIKQQQWSEKQWKFTRLFAKIKTMKFEEKWFNSHVIMSEEAPKEG